MNKWEKDLLMIYVGGGLGGLLALVLVMLLPVIFE